MKPERLPGARMTAEIPVLIEVERIRRPAPWRRGHRPTVSLRVTMRGQAPERMTLAQGDELTLLPRLDMDLGT